MLHLSNNIKLIRELYNQTQEEFVQHFTDVTLSMQKSYESGRAKPGILYLNQLSKLTGVAIEKLKDYPVEVEEVQKGEKVAKVDHRVIDTPQEPQPRTNPTEMSDDQRDWKRAYEDLIKAHTRYSKSHLILSQALYEMTKMRNDVDTIKTNLNKAVKDQMGFHAGIAAHEKVTERALEDLLKLPEGELSQKADTLLNAELERIAKTDTVNT